MADIEARKQRLAEMREARITKQQAKATAGPTSASQNTSMTSNTTGVARSLSPARGGREEPGSPFAGTGGSHHHDVELSKVTSLAPINVFPLKREHLNRDTMTDVVFVSNEAPKSATPQNLSVVGGNELTAAAPIINLEEIAETAARKALYPIGGTAPDPDILASVIASTDMATFTAKAAFVVQKTLSVGIEMSLEGALGVDSTSTTRNQLVAKRRAFFSEGVSNCVVTAIAFQGAKEYFAVAYTVTAVAEGQEDNVAEGKGRVLVWSVKQTTPVLEFIADSDISSLTYSPFHPQLLIGGCANGTIVVWDLMKGSKPVSKSFPSYEGHNRIPIIVTAVVGKQNHNALATVSQDGRFCLWDIEKATFPSASFDVALGVGGRAILTNAACMPSVGLNKFYVGTTEGKLYKGSRTGSSAGNCEVKLLDPKHHRSTVSTMECHPKLSKLILSCSVDSTCRLSYDREAAAAPSTSQASTSASAQAATADGEQADADAPQAVSSVVMENFADFVYDAKWSPSHPCVFVAGDGSGTLSFWNIVASINAPVATIKLTPSDLTTTATAINRLAWDAEGANVVAGNSAGEVFLVGVGGDLCQPTATDLNAFTELVGSLFGESQVAEAMNLAADE